MITLINLQLRSTGLLIIACAVAIALSDARGQTIVNATWNGDGSHNGSEKNGKWSNASLWTPTDVPNNNGSTVYNVTVPWDPNGDLFNGPQVDVNVTVQNFNLVNRVFLDNQGFPTTNLTVTGSTTISTSAGHDGETAAIFWAGGTCSLGTLTNYTASSKTLESGFFFPLAGGTIQFRGADIVTNNGTVIVGDNSRFLNQDTGLPAYAHLAVNNGGFNLGSGHDFTTSGNFTNNGGLAVGNSTDGLSTRLTIGGSLTNYDAGTHTLSGGYEFAVVNNAATGTVVLRFAGADIRTISGTAVRVEGPGAAITDLAGNNALRNLSRIQGATFTSSGVQTYTPAGGTLTNNGATHNIAPGSSITVQGNFNVTNGGHAIISAPTANSNTVVVVQGSMLFDAGAGLDMGGQPGVNTQYHSQLQVINGIEYRGAFLTGTGTTFADIIFTQNAHLQPGHSPGQLEINGALSFDPTTEIDIQIGGLGAGDGFDQVVQHGAANVTLNGVLDLSFVDGFENSIQHSDTFDIITSDNNLAGAFTNVASGERLATSDGLGSFKVTYANQKTVTLSEYQATLKLVSAASRATHGTAGDIDLPIDLIGGSTVEPRGLNNYQIVLTFSNSINDGTFTISAPSGGSVSSASYSGRTVIVTLSGVANPQLLTFNLNDVVDEYAQELTGASFNIGFLLGDVSGDGSVNSGDATITRNRSGQTANPTNFRSDVNLDGNINSADATIIRNRSGSSVPVAGRATQPRAGLR